MGTKFTPAQLERFSREAKKISREQSISHTAALDRIAVGHGFKNWALLHKHANAAVEHAVPPGFFKVPVVPASKLWANGNAKQVAHHLHGDLVGLNPPRYYCARCDHMVGPEHFQPTPFHTDGEDGEVFLRALERWNRLTLEQRRRRFRLPGTNNILEAEAIAAREAKLRAQSPFFRWLMTQSDRNDPVGDLARDAARDKAFPTHLNSLDEIQRYLGRYGDAPQQAAKEAWSEFPQRRPSSLALALAAELGISPQDAEELVDVEPQALTGSTGEMVYSYLFDFSGVASPRLAKRLLKAHGSLKLEVGPAFFDRE